MTENQWEVLVSFREAFRKKCFEWATCKKELSFLQEKIIEQNVQQYSLENPVVYNRFLDEVTKDDEIKLVIIGDNPGMDEQKEKNCRYLVGQSGKIATSFFAKHPELEVDFRKNVLILNKTPIHTPKTKDLQVLQREGSVVIKKLLEESQIWMAEKTLQFFRDFNRAGSKVKTELWLVGYSELKKKGVFLPYKETFIRECHKDMTDIFVFQHFSMNCFAIDLKKNFDEKKTVKENLHCLGQMHRKEIFEL